MILHFRNILSQVSLCLSNQRVRTSPNLFPFPLTVQQTDCITSILLFQHQQLQLIFAVYWKINLAAVNRILPHNMFPPPSPSDCTEWHVSSWDWLYPVWAICCISGGPSPQASTNMQQTIMFFSGAYFRGNFSESTFSLYLKILNVFVFFCQQGDKMMYRPQQCSQLTLVSLPRRFQWSPMENCLFNIQWNTTGSAQNNTGSAEEKATKQLVYFTFNSLPCLPNILTINIPLGL